MLNKLTNFIAFECAVFTLRRTIMVLAVLCRDILRKFLTTCRTFIMLFSWGGIFSLSFLFRKFRSAFYGTYLSAFSFFLRRIAFYDFSTNTTSYCVTIINAFKQMKTIMFRFAENFKIFKTIILFIFNITNRVFGSSMMDDFVRFKISTEMSFHNQATFKNIILFGTRMIGFINKNISGSIYFSSLNSATAETSTRTKMILRPCISLKGALKYFTTSFTFDFHRIGVYHV